MAFCMFQRGDYILHASSISISNKAYLFIGPSTTGKSYIVGSLLKFGKFITEDIAKINLEGEPYIYSGPPIIKLCKDFFKSNKLNYDSSFSIRSDARERLGYILDKSSLASNKTEIAACFIINPSSNNSIKEVKKDFAFKHLLLNSFSNIPRNSCYESEKMLHDNLNKFLRKVKIFQFNRSVVDYDNFLMEYIYKNFN